MLIYLNKVWSIKIVSGDTFILCRDGREFRSFISAKALVDDAKKFIPNVDPGAYVKVLLWHQEASRGEPSVEPEGKPSRVGYWLNPEQLAGVPR